MSTDNTPAPQVEMVSEVPELPDPEYQHYEYDLKRLADTQGYTADQMRAYAQAALNARAGGDGELVQLLVELREYMHDRADADHDGEKFVGNVEMGLGERIDAALASQAVGVKDGR